MGTSSKASVNSSIKDLKSKGTVKTSESTFKKVIKAISSTYSDLIKGKSVTVDYANFQITLN